MANEESRMVVKRLSPTWRLDNFIECLHLRQWHIRIKSVQLICYLRDEQSRFRRRSNDNVFEAIVHNRLLGI